MKQLFTSESVTEGHPDKICDQISDAVLDAILAQDPYARVACETCTTTGIVMVMGEVTTTADYRVDDIVREVVCDIGYDRAKYGFDGHTCAVLTAMHGQSPDIAMGVDDALEGRGVGDMDIGAGDQGMMFGFACDETPEMMPMPIALAHRITRRLSQARRSEELPWLRPDGKSQVTIEYDGDKPVRVDTVVVSTQHAPEISHEELSAAIIDKVICKSIPAELMDENTRFLINPTGRFTIGGPMGDSGLTGRKIIVDTYGGYARHGGGAFSGKDPTKVDRSAAYAARYIAKNIVAAGLAKRCEIELAYAIGVANPVSLLVDTQGTGVISDDALAKIVREQFDLRPAGIIDMLNLRRPIYRQTAAFGHFGRTDVDLPWERVDRAETLRAAGLRVKLDESEQSPGWKFAEYEMKGVPLRLELGPKDIEQNQCVLVRRDNGEKSFVSLDSLVESANTLMDAVHDGMYAKAKRNLDENIYDAFTLEEAKRLQQEHGGFIRTMWCGDEACEIRMKEEAGMTSRCIPFAQQHLADTCAICGKPAKKMIYWGVAY